MIRAALSDLGHAACLSLFLIGLALALKAFGVA